MKKVLFLILTILCLVGCSNSLKDLNGNEKEEFKLNETAIYKGVKYTVIAYEIKDKKDSITDKNISVIDVTYSIENTNKKNVEYNLDSLLYENDKELYPGILRNQDLSDLLEDKELFSGRTYTLIDEFEISDKNSNFEYLMIIDDEASIQMKVKLK